MTQFDPAYVADAAIWSAAWIAAGLLLRNHLARAEMRKRARTAGRVVR